MKKSEATNTFHQGLLMDLNPMVTPNDVVTNCLNGTLLTYNGNENVLQNDMGNGRVETAMLPQGYIPLGIAELGGIIYIASYNPLTKKSQIGSFPSPERTISSNEISSKQPILDGKQFCGDSLLSYPKIITNIIKIILTDNDLHPGDKFLINIQNDSSSEAYTYLSASGSEDHNINKSPKWIKLHVVSIQEDGKIVYLDDNLVWYDQGDNNQEITYYLKTGKIDEGSQDLDEYRNVVQSNYSIFTSKTPGKLAILAELEAIDTFSVTMDFEVNDSDSQNSKEAIPIFNVNWTSINPLDESRSKINPEAIIVDTNTSQPTSLSINLDTTRRNDGTDNPITIQDKNYKFNYSANNSSLITFTIFPAMEYGYLDYLKTSLQFDLNKLGTGLNQLTEFRYFVEENLLTLSYGFESYPERNKQVENVKIEFFPFNQSIYRNISQDMDDSYVIESKGASRWENGSNNITKIEYDDPVQYIINLNQSSINGHFNTKIQFDQSEQLGLKPDSCYLTKITINYNNEKNIIFYRLLYTNSVFNSQYYVEDDYKNLILGDYLEVKYETNIQSLESTPILINNGMDDIKMYVEDRNEKGVTYPITNTVRNTLSLNIEATSNYSLFETKINKLNTLTSTPKIEYKSNPKQETITGGKSPIEVTFDNDRVTVNLTLNEGVIQYQFTKLNTVNSPIYMDYTQSQPIPINYEMVPLSGDGYYLNGWGLQKTHTYGLSVSRLGSNGGPTLDGEAALVIGDKESKYTTIDNLGIISQAILNILENQDFVAIWCNILYCIQSDTYLRSICDNYTSDIAWASNGASVGQLDQGGVLFVFKNTSGQIQCIAFPTTNGKGIPITLMRADKNYEQFRFDIAEPFRNYYKLSSYAGEGKINWTYGNIVYWDDFKVETLISDTITSVYELTINNVEISLPQIKNLTYNPNIEDTVDCTISNNFDVGSVFRNKLKNIATANYVYLNGEYVTMPDGISPSSVYSKDGKLVSFVLRENGIPSKVGLRVNNGMAAITLSSQLKVAELKWTLENKDQNLSIKNIYLIQ